ncbi:putative FAD-linked oxidoreductase YvdP [Mycobacterium basiliense]|uniref:Putative FAD-linked oxidoreductase YvdP n=2 Tax=Mycobacterium basiliense TaxID=2094119 RepID=A0A3S4DRN8_9MYCO|nr:putative FAD-linked oxidoreductase YvdP [Mycobacterium basiliense]
MISRQTFLRGTVGAVATSALFGSVRARADTVGDWSGLASAIEGRVLLPSSGASFTSGKQVFNTRYNGSNPAAVIAVASQADVEKAVAFAAANKLKIAPRSGGHSYIGASTAGGAMVIDLRGLPGGVNFDGATGNVTMPAATGLYEVHKALAPAGRTIPTGSCPTVGTAGLTLGGGLGADSRRAGLTCDALKSATVVLPTGQTVTASADEHPDLFWALRGGGGGNFGVTTSMTFTTFPTADADVVRVDFTPSSAAQVLSGWQTWLASADRDTWALMDMSVGSSKANCHVLAVCPAGSGRAVADALKSAAGVQPTGVEIKTLGYMDLVTYLAGGSPTSAPRGFVAGSDVIGNLNPAAAQAIVTAIGKWPPASGQAAAIIDPLSGAVGDVDPSATAFPWRRQAAVVSWYVETPGSSQAAAANKWISTAHQTVQQFSVGGYVNYLEANTAPSRYFGSNLSRLTEIRQKYDPDRLMYSGLNF